MGGLGVGMGVGGGMYFGVGTPSMTPLMTPWSNQNTPGYGSSVWSPGQGNNFTILFKLLSFDYSCSRIIVRIVFLQLEAA